MIEERIVLQEALRDHMKEHAGETYHRECCGLLFGTVTEDGAYVIRDTVRVENRVAEDRRKTHYGIDPMELYGYEKEKREAGNDILGFYHSHPDHPSIPSDEDIREMVPGMLYLIISVIEGKPTRLRGWKQDAATGQVREIRIFLTEPY